MGAIYSYDVETGELVVDGGGYFIVGFVTENTEIEFEEAEGEDYDERRSDEYEDREATEADLQPGTLVAELDFEEERGEESNLLEEIELYQVSGN